MIKNLSTGDKIHRYQKSLVINFAGKRNVLSTGVLNGGYREDLKHVFNHDANPGAGMAATLKAPTYEEHMILIAEEIGLNPNVTSGMSTAASMENVSIKTVSFRDLTVTAIVTGGVEVNGGRVGDPASFYEESGKIVKVKEGTINIMLMIDASLSPYTLTRALVTCTEAKTAALQELVAGSNYSRGIATGSGTDGTMVICNAESEMRLTNSGKHSKLGELIGVSVKEAVKEALYLQSGLNAESQHSVMNRLKRFGVTEDRIWERFISIKDHMKTSPPSEEDKSQTPHKSEYLHHLHMIDRDEELVLVSSMFAHLLDQYHWKLINDEQAISEAHRLLGRIYKLSHHPKTENEKGDLIESLVNGFILNLSLLVGGRANE